MGLKYNILQSWQLNESFSKPLYNTGEIYQQWPAQPEKGCVCILEERLKKKLLMND